MISLALVLLVVSGQKDSQESIDMALYRNCLKDAENRGLECTGTAQRTKLLPALELVCSAEVQVAIQSCSVTAHARAVKLMPQSESLRLGHEQAKRNVASEMRQLQAALDECFADARSIGAACVIGKTPSKKCSEREQKLAQVCMIAAGFFDSPPKAEPPKAPTAKVRITEL